MRRIRIKNVLAPLALAVSAMFVSCNEESYREMDHSQSNPVEVGFYAGGQSTRTEMLEDGLSATWTDGDQIALWAKSSSGSFYLSNQIFKTYGYDKSLGYFTTTLPSEMPEDTYTYYCTYPAPQSVNGNTAYFYLPNIQNGKASGGVDIMVADPVNHGALTAVPEIEDHSGLSMRMNRMMHQFRFWIPSEDTPLKNDAIGRMVLTFPTQVAGDIQLDMTDPSRSAVLSGGYREITLNLEDFVSFKKQNFACVAIVPTRFVEGQELQLKAYTEDKIVQFAPIDLKSRTCLAGHSTPVMLIPSSITEYPYQIAFKVVANNLGEDVNEIRFEAPAGCVWPEHDSNVCVYRRKDGLQITTGEVITFRFESEAQYRKFSNATVNVTYDSENAITAQSVTIANLSGVEKTVASLTIPYLFYQDFSSVPSFSDGYDNETVGAASSLYKGIKELSQFTPVLAGWFATRIGVQGGTAARICCRYEDVLGQSAYYKGRLYTPFLTNIKDDHDVDIQISFRYGGDRKEMLGWNFKYPLKSPVLYFGVNTQENVINPDQNQGDLIDQITGMIGGSGFSSKAATSLSPMAIKGEAIPIGGSYADLNRTRIVNIEGVDNGMRLGWILSTDSEAGSVNANYWLYIDDIKVWIVK